MRKKKLYRQTREALEANVLLREQIAEQQQQIDQLNIELGGRDSRIERLDDELEWMKHVSGRCEKRYQRLYTLFHELLERGNMTQPDFDWLTEELKK